jgi:hypothetical protein
VSGAVRGLLTNGGEGEACYERERQRILLLRCTHGEKTQKLLDHSIVSKCIVGMLSGRLVANRHWP